MKGRKGKAWRGFLLLCALLCLLALPRVRARAGTIFESPYVSWSPDFTGWTVCEPLPYTDLWLNYKKSGNLPEYWYPQWETHETGIASSLREPGTGEHLYTYDRTGEIPVGKWVNEHSYGSCIHTHIKKENYGGFAVNSLTCYNAYYSGWVCYCADCGGTMYDGGLMYMSRDAMKSLTSLNVDYDWFYMCPTCTHLENTRDAGPHECKDISWNQYKVRYDYNVPGEDVEVEDSIHMYNNATVYEGEEITPVTKLNINTFERLGYTFMGWSTTPEGPVEYEDEAEIYNLCEYDWHPQVDGDLGVVTLYAVWEYTESTLKIDPAGGTFEGRSGITTLTRGYGDTYIADPSLIVGPSGFTVSFDTKGGSVVAPMSAPAAFFGWQKSSPFNGYFKESTHTYYFEGAMGSVDTLTADYQASPIILPTAEKAGEVFGGWYEDAECTIPAGFAGDEYLASRDTTLYASWTDLTLSSRNNLTAHGGKGAVDLWWAQKDNSSKSYKMYQSEDNVDFRQIFTASEVADRNNVDKSFSYRGGAETYTVQYTGIYTLSASGAQGGGYGSYTGGKGGTVTARFYLKRGDVITVSVGGSNGYNGGGTASAYGKGGGCTVITSNEKGVLLIAGGGGGASGLGNGGAGGSTLSVTNTYLNGASGMAGGGGGYRGGTAGTVVYHTHKNTCGNHTHSGNATSGGACYATAQYDSVTCTVTTRRGQFNKLWSCTACGNNSFHYWGWEGVHSVCGASDWQTCETTCTSCGAQGGDTHPDIWGSTNYFNKTHTETTQTGYKKTCTVPEGWQCGKTTSTVDASNPAYGGSSYVASGALSQSNTPGNRSGNGVASISAETVGFTEGLSISGVKAYDKAAPDAVDEDAVVKNPLSASTIRVTFERPRDYGTDYYHYVESYTPDGTTKLLNSNTVRNILVSGFNGYYYILDTTAVRDVNASNAQGSLAKTQTTVDVNLAGDVQYLHIAAFDVAGNVGPTAHIIIERGEMEWPIETGQMQITDEIGGRDYGTVYAKPGATKTYFVRADGNTPFMLSFASYMDGTARDDYQIDIQSIASAFDAPGITQKFTTKLPYTVPYTTNGNLPVSGFSRSATGSTILKDVSNTGASRSNSSRNNSFYQCFAIPVSHNGKTIVVTPMAGATGEEETVTSVWDKDILNAITLIADGEAPVVSGAEILEGMDVINKSEGVPVITVTATDAISGLRKLEIVIVNLDSMERKSLTADTTGSITIDLSEETPLYAGNIGIQIIATDNVGNQCILEYGALGLNVFSEITRILEPHNPLFKGGESGILHITTWGYVDYVEVEFPPEMLALHSDMNQTFTYSPYPPYTWKEELQFMIPVYTPSNREYTITVRAYKGDTVLESHPTLHMVEDGSTILDELRTRLR